MGLDWCSGVSIASSIALALLALAAIAAALMVVLGFRRLGAGDAGPETSVLRDEPAAVVNLLVHSAGVTRAAIVATLLELAHRDVTEVIEPRPGRYAVRLKSGPEHLPTAIERLAVDAICSRAIPHDGISIRRALPWYRARAFRQAVVNEAVDRGLFVGRRFLFADRFSFLAVGLATAGLVVLGVNPGVAVVEAALAVVLLQMPSVLLGRRRRGVLTAAGEVAAAQWLGVREYLEHDPELTHAPPTSVVVWGPYLAAAVALDAAQFELVIAPSAAPAPVDGAQARLHQQGYC